jgi:S1-C subfamily serine protease
LEHNEKQRSSRIIVILVIIVICSLVAGGSWGYFVCYSGTSERINLLEDQITVLKEQISQSNTASDEIISQLNDQVEDLQTQFSSLQNQIYNLEAKEDFPELESIQNQFISIQEQISSLEVAPEVTIEDITDILTEIDNLKNQQLSLQQQINNLETTPSITYQNFTYVLDEASLSELFDQVRESIVVVQTIITQYDFFGRPHYTLVQGSGFVYRNLGQMIILTNYHVVSGATDINVTFTSGNSYEASVLGSDQYIDLAILTTNAPSSEYSPLDIVSSSNLKVGNPVIVVGTPYGLAGSMSNGIISALNRTLVDEDFSIENVIQTTAPINPGNSGGPLLNYEGQVIGIVTAIIEDSQGIGFAIPSDSILKGLATIVL